VNEFPPVSKKKEKDRERERERERDCIELGNETRLKKDSNLQKNKKNKSEHKVQECEAANAAHKILLGVSPLYEPLYFCRLQETISTKFVRLQLINTPPTILI